MHQSLQLTPSCLLQILTWATFGTGRCALLCPFQPLTHCTSVYPGSENSSDAAGVLNIRYWGVRVKPWVLTRSWRMLTRDQGNRNLQCRWRAWMMKEGRKAIRNFSALLRERGPWLRNIHQEDFQSYNCPVDLEECVALLEDAVSTKEAR